MSEKRVALRGHHLICLHFFHGEGYGPTFVENLRQILKRLEKRRGLVIEGPDDVCRACPHLKENYCSFQPKANEEIEYLDNLALSLLKLKPGEPFLFSRIKRVLPEVIEEWERKACLECHWSYVCLGFIEQIKEQAKSFSPGSGKGRPPCR